MALADKARKSATENENNRGSRGSGNYDGIDLTGDEKQVQLHPGSFIKGTVPEDEGNPIIKFRPYDSDAQEVNAGGNVGIILDDAEIVIDDDEGTGDTIILESQDEDEYWDYRIYNPERHGTNVEEGYGVEFNAGQGNRLYKGDLVDEIDGERVLVVVSGGGAVSVAKAIDVKGGPSAVYDYEDEYDGQSNGGLIEYPMYEDGERVDVDGEPVDFGYRYTRRPELREELYGATLGIMMDWWTNSVIYDELDEDGQNRYDSIVDGDKNDSYYYTVFNVDTEEVLEAGEYGEPEQRSWLEWRYDPDGEGGYLPDDQYEFVQGYIDNQSDYSEEAIRNAVENNADKFDSEPRTNAIVERIQEQTE